MGQGRVSAVDVVRDVAVIAEDQVGLVVLLAAALAHGSVQASPALLEDHLGHLDIDAVGMITLTTLSFLISTQ